MPLLGQIVTSEVMPILTRYSLKDNEFYFDRDPANFNCILNFYRTEKLHMTDEMCVLSYADDLKFWMIHEINMHICCVDKFHARRDTILTNIEKENATLGGEEGPEEDFGDGYFANYQKALWDLFENPQSSIAAKILSLISIGLVLASLVGMCLNTFTWLQVPGLITLSSNFTSKLIRLELTRSKTCCSLRWRTSMGSQWTTQSWRLLRQSASPTSLSSSY